MNRLFTLTCSLACLIAVVCTTSIRAQSTVVPLIPQTEAEHAGLKRAWFTQVPLDPARSKITHVTFQADLLMVVTDDGMLHVFDPETGLRQWSFPVGNPKFVATSAGANATNVAVANHERLYVLDRASGNLVFNHLLTGTPDGGPALTDHHVIMPLVRGPLEVYPLNEKWSDLISPYYLTSAGRLIGELETYDLGVTWAGDSNLINGHQFADQGPQFTVTVVDGVTTGPALFAPRIYLGTEVGNLIAYDIATGDEVWKFATGSKILHQPVVIGPVVYALPEDGGMFAVRSDTGVPLWFSRDPIQFVSASPERIYTLDKFRRLAILDPKTGAHIQTLPLPQSVKLLVNDHSDRILTYTQNGLLQCLHEPKLDQPHLYIAPKIEPPKKGPSIAPKPASDPATPPAAEAAPAAEAPPM